MYLLYSMFFFVLYFLFIFFFFCFFYFFWFCLFFFLFFFFFFQAEDGIRDGTVTGVQTCALPIFSLMPVKIFERRVRSLSICDCSFLESFSSVPSASIFSMSLKRRMFDLKIGRAHV